MKRILVALLILLPSLAISQTYVHQLIVANGGLFEVDPPFVDQVSVGAYYPNLERYEVFGSIGAQYVLQVEIGNNSIYVAAGDSLIRYHLDNHNRLAATAIPGINSMTVWNTQLVVSKGFGADSNYVEVLDANDLSLLYALPEVNDEAAAIAIANDSAYVAVPGDWMATTGRIAVIDLNNQSFSRFIELDTLGAGISALYTNNSFVYSINTIAFGSTYGVISRFDIANNTAVHSVINSTVSEGAGLVNDTLFATFGGTGIGRFDVNTMQLIDTVIVGATAFAAASSHGANRIFYTTETDYFSFGRAVILSRNGTELQTIDLDIAPEAIALDIRTGNSRPYALADHYSLNMETTGVFDVQANDLDPDNNAYATTMIVAPLQGPSQVLNFDSIQYDPWDQFYGFDQFQYSICDNGSPQLCDTATVTLDVVYTLGMNATLVQPGYVLFPNPATTQLRVAALPGNAITGIRVFDLSGRAVISGEQHSPVAGKNIDVSTLPAGIYLAEIQNNRQVVRQRFIVQ